MDNKLFEVVRKYKCCVCDHLLSVPPVMIAQYKSMCNDDNFYKCGRCESIDYRRYNWIRNRIFEEMVQNLCFPCCNTTCTEILAWDKVQQHEDICRYKTIKCPLSSSCGCIEEILVDNLGEHVTDKHANKHIKGSAANCCSVLSTVDYIFPISSYHDEDYTYFLEANNQYFIVFSREFYKIAVMSTRYSKYTEFNVKLKSHKNNNYSVFIEKLPIICYNSKFDEISVDNFMINLRNKLTEQCPKDASACITLIADKDDDKEARSVQFNVEAAKKALTCPYCMSYMTSPIFACFTGHTICDGCKSRLEKCPTCQASLDGTRIFALEEMADNIEIPCQFTDNGCSLVGNVSTLRAHELECSFKGDC